MLKKLLPVVCLFLAINANATLIVDTGEPVPDDVGASQPTYNNDSYNFYYGQYFAGMFGIEEDYLLNSIEGFFSNNSGFTGDVVVSILSDDFFYPGETLFSGVVSLAANASMGWYGITGLDWLLTAGDYWVSFVPKLMDAGANQSVHGLLPTSARGTMDEYIVGYEDGWSPSLVPYNNAFLPGVRIDGDINTEPNPNPVPESSILLLFVIGLLSLKTFNTKRA
ncbi:hypothetical protein [Neptunicella marina]|uniref:PEP-CTERM sorting domain-containing protein n=1 Tax=Neptunicella marina TaxID=2125989 RepID=A0A8J6M1J9_9ALTE|nr:hypothetical protein [Neptunicella marina]MBC3767709.1 hypothetical protein [Neptunicella marina]